MEPEIEVIDHRMTEKYRRQQSVTTEEGGEVIFHQEDGWAYETLPEDVMSILEKHLGDGNAKVTVSADLGVNEFGNKAGAFFSVSVACGGNEDDIEAVRAALTSYVHETVESDCRKLMGKRDAMCGIQSPPPVQSGPPSSIKRPKPTKRR